MVIAIDDLKSLEETLAVLQNEKVMRDLAVAEREVADGDTLDADELRSRVTRGAQAGA